MRKHRVVSVLGATMLAACSSAPKTAESVPTQAASEGAEAAEAHGLGGRLFDHWAKELQLDFVPDNPETPEADGRGGPFGNGTLPDRSGKPMLNSGHGYRLKNLFGWDMRGADGIYGPAYQNKSHVLLPDLLKNSDPREVWIERLQTGEDAIPAYGSVLTRPQLEALVDFMLGVRDGALPGPEEVFALSTGTPGNYTLVEAGDPVRGQAYYAETCAGCHGEQGTKFLLDGGKQSLGMVMRTEAYETWLKVLSGQPGSSMHAQVPAHASHEDLTRIVQDLNAATCNRIAFPKGAATGEDVPDGDPRCGEKLK